MLYYLLGALIQVTLTMMIVLICHYKHTGNGLSYEGDNYASLVAIYFSLIAIVYVKVLV